MATRTKSSSRPERREQIAQWAQLTYYYGIGPDVLAKTPYGIINIYVDELPKLIASAQLRAIEASSFGDTSEANQRDTMRSLQRYLEPKEPPKIDEESAKIMIAAAGIGLVFEEGKHDA